MRAYWLHTANWSRIVTQRVRRPESVAERLASRCPPDEPVPPDGQLVLISCNHDIDPRTGAAVDRRELLDRIIEALSIPEVDGVVGSADILEELTLLNVLEHRLAFGIASGESHGVAPSAIVASNFDGGVLAQHWGGVGSLRTPQPENARADAVELAAEGLPTLVDLRITSAYSGSELDTDWADWIKPLHATTATFATGAGVWISVPAVRGISHLAEATGAPLLIRDTDVPIQPSAWQSFFQEDLPLTVRGMLAGASALFPIEGTVAEATALIARSVRNRLADPEVADLETD